MRIDNILHDMNPVEGVSQEQARAVLKSYGQLVVGALELGDDIALLGVGKIKCQITKARKGRNPKTGEVIDITAKRTGKLALAAGVKRHLNP